MRILLGFGTVTSAIMAQMTTHDVIALIGQLGFPIFLALCLMFYFYRREEHLSRQVEKRETVFNDRFTAAERFQQETLVGLVRDVAAATTENTASSKILAGSLQDLSERTTELISILENRPCVAGQAPKPPRAAH